MTDAELNPTVEKLAKQFSKMDPREFELAWMSVEAAVVREMPISVEGYRAFAKLMMYDPATPEIILEPAKHHMDWIETCVNENRICILAPPESAKTTIISVLFTAYVMGKRPMTMNVVVSVSDKQAEDIVGTIAAYIEYHPAWKLCFPDVVKDKARGWGLDKGFFVKRAGDYGDWLRERGTRKDPSLVGFGYGNRAIIGKRVDGVFIVDDMMDETNTRSEAELDYAKNQFVKVISSRPTEAGRLILVGTPWREDDVYATAVATGLYSNHITPAWHEEEDGLTKKLVSYWPEQWSIERLQRKAKEFGERDFQLMYLMNLEAAKGTILKREWLSPMFPSIQIDPAWPMYYGIDPAITSWDFGLKGRGSKRSYFALAKIVAAPFGLIVKDIIRKQFSLAEALELVRTHSLLDHPKMIFMETWGSGEAILQSFYSEGVIAQSYKDTHDKTARFIAMARHFEIGRVRISDAETNGLRALKDEWIGYPSSRLGDDTLDAVCAGVAAAGVNVYAGSNLLNRDIKTEETNFQPWGGSMGMPGSRFGGRNTSQRKVRVPYGS